MLRIFSLFLVLFLTAGFLVFTSFAGTAFTDVTREAGVGDEGASSGIAIGDYDNDDDLDIYVSNGFFAKVEGNVLYQNNGDGTFTKVTVVAGVQAMGQGFPTAFFDCDNDGFLDLYVVNYGQRDFLFHNEGDGTFADVTKSAGIEDPNWGVGLATFDYNNDGLLDIYVGNGTQTGHKNNLYHNNGDGTFKDVAKAARVEFAAGTNAGPAFCDYDDDGDMDIYVANDGGAGILFRNNDDGTFDDVTDNAKINPVSISWTAAWGDYNNDGDFDLYIPGSLRPNQLYRNNGDGTFKEVAKDAGITHVMRAWSSAAFGDYDNDGYLDICVTGCGAGIVVGPTPIFLYHNNGDGTFTDVTKTVGLEGISDKSGPIFFDYDNDGDLDIYIPNWRGANILYRNDGNDNHWLHIKTIGTESNRDGIGAKVKVVAGELSMLRMVGVGSSNGQNSLPVEFGLGEQTRADLVEIRWPSGQVDVFENVAADQFITVKEGIGIVSSRVVQPQGKQIVSWGKIKHTQLLQNYPNPFNPETWIPYCLTQSSSVVINIYNIKGQLVRSLNLGKQLADVYVAKDKAAYWDGKNSLGERVVSGVYFYTLEVGKFTATRKMTIVK